MGWFPSCPKQLDLRRRTKWLADNHMYFEMSKAVIQRRDSVDKWWKGMTETGWQLALMLAIFGICSVGAYIKVDSSPEFWGFLTVASFLATIFQVLFVWRRSVERETHWIQLSNISEVLRLKAMVDDGQISDEEGLRRIVEYEAPELP